MGILTKGEKNAYDMLKVIDQMNMKYWLPIGATTLYETCIRLQKKGLIEDTGEAENKAVYCITDAGRKELCLRASDVLDKRTGLCFGKSHLLCALLRAAGIPSGLCYQYLRLDDNDEDSPLILHGLTAIYFESLGKWIRVDARGNKPGVTAEFSVEEEKLAFPVRPGLGETDLPFIFPRPDIGVIGKLLLSKTAQEAMANLPDRIAGKC